VTDVDAALAEHRGYLLGVAYRLLGSMDDAEDVVQEAYLRARRVDAAEIAEPRAWLTTVVSRLALDQLTSARARREAYVGPWLPEPLVATADDPADRVTLDDQLTYALMTVLETLSPAERAVYVLHEAFAVPLDEVAAIVGRTPAATRQLAVRARRHVQDRAPRFDADPGRRAEVVAAFQAACEGGDVEALAALLDDHVLLRTDGGGVVAAARRPITGRTPVVRTLVSALRSAPDVVLRPVTVDGLPGLLARYDGRVVVFAFVVDGGRITHVDVIANPQKLARARGSRAAD
jgi:RNA polymerase sigma-70 factor (ECF subfamily)